MVSWVAGVVEMVSRVVVGVVLLPQVVCKVGVVVSQVVGVVAVVP